MGWSALKKNNDTVLSSDVDSTKIDQSKDGNYLHCQSVILKHDENELHICRRGYENNLITDFFGLETITDIFSDCVQKYAHKHFHGSRVVIKKEITQTLDGKPFIQHTLGGFQWESYGEIWLKIQCYCAFLRHLNFDSSKKVAIWADTCSDWFCACMALIYLKIQVVTVYATLVDDTILHALYLTEVDAIFVDARALTRLIKLIPKLHTIKNIFLLGAVNKDDLKMLPDNIETPTLLSIEREERPAIKLSENVLPLQRFNTSLQDSPLFFSIDSDPIVGESCCEVKDSDTRTTTTVQTDRANLKCYHINQFFVHGRQYLKNKPLEFEKVNKNDIALIMFTSGSSGIPKGVVLQHKNIAASLGGICYRPELFAHPIYAAYMPLAHIMEFGAELIVAANAGAVGYCRSLTLFNGTPMLAPGTNGDLIELKPTFGTFVPLILERIKKNVIDKLTHVIQPSLVLNENIDLSKEMYEINSDASDAEHLAFSKVRALVGGNYTWNFCGGAPLAPSTQKSISVAFGCPLIQGYGLTETSGCGTWASNDDPNVGHTGPPNGNSEIKLIPWLEGGYTPNDKPNPRGEIVIGGEGVAMGYYKNKKSTAEAFYVGPNTNQRWFKTGDIGEFCSNGTIKIIDRKKDIVKLKHGEYVSLVQIESIAQQSQYIELCCALPNNNFDYIVLMVMPNREKINYNLHKLNPELLNSNISFGDIITDEKVFVAICDDIFSIFNRKSHSKFELPHKISLVADIWVPESGLLTPSMKFRRTEMTKFYFDILEH